jgi:hypothetical protein
VLRLCRLCNQLETILDQLKSATFLQTISLQEEEEEVEEMHAQKN